MAWMRRYWPLTMAVAYLLCHALIYLAGWLWSLPPETPQRSHNVPDIRGLVLFGAAFFGMRWAIVGRRRIIGVAVVVASLSGQGWRMYDEFDAASSASWLAEMHPDSSHPRIAQLPEAAMRSNRGHPGHSGRIAAQFYFTQTGVPIPYRDESDEVRMFEPTAKATGSWEDERDGRKLLEESRPRFRAFAATFQWFGYSKLFLAAASIFGALALFWRRKPQPHVAIDSATKQPVPDQ